MKKIIVRLLIIGFIIGAIAIAMIILPNVKSTDKTEYLLIHKGASYAEVIDSLENKSSFRSVTSFNILARIIGYPQKVKEGRYELKAGMSNLKLLNNLLKGRQKPARVTFNNIRTKELLCQRLSQQLMFDSLELHNLLSDNKFLKEYGLNSENSVAIFIPNTYEFFWNISAKKLIARMYNEYKNFWTASRMEKAYDLKLSPLEVSTLASIVEEESNMESEKPTIAGLYLNRLRIGMPLQADPTIKFALKDFDIKRVFFKHIEETKDSPYNTYLKKGLPPGPIRIPTIKSIDAVLNYESHSYLFMCAKGNGGRGHDFTCNFNDHINNANRYRKQMDKLGVK